MRRGTGALAFLITLLIVASLLLIACGGSSQKTAQQTATVNLSLSDPPTCSANTPAQGPFTAIFVTVKDVQVNTSPTAGDNDSSWLDLTPNLRTNPVQVNLIGHPVNGCFLVMLGTAGIPPGTYRQVRLVLTDTDVPSNGNGCNTVGVYNCVIPTLTPDSPQPLLLSSEAKTGIKIPSGQIAGGAFTIAAGQTKDLNIDLDGCDSIVVQGGPSNPQYRLKPVAHAGEVSTPDSAAITGRLVDKDGNPLTNTKAMVLLEQSTNNIDRKILQLTPDANGNFSLCPVPAGAFDVVAVAINSNGAYGPTIIPGVKAGTSLGDVKLPLSSTGGSNPSTLPASLKGTIGSAPKEADFVLSALQPVTINSMNVQVTIPLVQESSATHKLSTACSGGACSASYSLAVPAAAFTVGTLSSTGVSYAFPAANATTTYSVEAATTTCSPSPQTANATNTVAPGADVTMQPLSFTSCQ